jgi:hypothetical protein
MSAEMAHIGSMLSVCIASDIYRITGPGAGWLAALVSASLRRFNFLRFIAR